MTSTEHAFFYNSENKDRVYDADSFEYWLKKFFTTGVFTGDLQATANDNMTVTLASGYANVEGKVRFFDAAQTFTLTTADATYNRIDAVVIERNDSDRDITAKIVSGAYSTTPVAPTMVRANGVYQICVAQIYVAAGAVRVTQANITDTRSDTTLCGIVAGTVNEMDFSQFAAQFTAYYNEFISGNKSAFDTWFAAMKDQLTTDAAGHLQTEIDTTNTNVTALNTNVTALQHKHGEVSYTIAHANWSASTTTLNGKAYYTYSISLTNVYEDHPGIIEGAAGTLPTEAEDTAYALMKHATVNDTAKTLTLYAESVPKSDFVIIVRGVA